MSNSSNEVDKIKKSITLFKRNEIDRERERERERKRERQRETEKENKKAQHRR